MQAQKHSRKRDGRQAMRDASRLPQPSIVDIDPEDPSQLLDDAGDYTVRPIDIEAQPSAEAQSDFDQAAADTFGDSGAEDDPREVLNDEPNEVVGDGYAAEADETGELYGVHVPPAGDTNLSAPEDHDAYEGAELGQNWLEALERHAAESGPVPEEEVDVVDESDEHRGPRPTERGDRPIADKGSGGPAGL